MRNPRELTDTVAITARVPGWLMHEVKLAAMMSETTQQDWIADALVEHLQTVQRREDA